MTNVLGIGPQTPVSALLKAAPVRLRSDWSIGAAARLIREENVSSAIVGGGEAIVTERDLVRALAAGLGPEAAVSAVAVSDLITVSADTSIVDAAAEMLRHEIRHLVVTNHGSVAGVISLRDVMAVLLQALEPEVWVATLRAAIVGNSELWLG